LSGFGREQLMILDEIEALADVREEWNRLAALAGSPFLTCEWISTWWSALGDGEPLVVLLRDSASRLRAGACCRRSSSQLTASTDVYLQRGMGRRGRR